MSTTSPTLPRFTVGDRVQLVKPGPNCGLIGKVVEVDTSRLLPHYWVDFSNVFRLRYLEGELKKAD